MESPYANEPAKLGIPNAVIEDARRGVRKDFASGNPAARELPTIPEIWFFAAHVSAGEQSGGLLLLYGALDRRILLRKANFGVSGCV